MVDLIESEQLDKTQQIVLSNFLLISERCKLMEVPPFSQIVLENIKHLSLEENKITRIWNLEKMPNLEKLNLDGNKIFKIENLNHLATLKILKIGIESLI